MPRWDVDRSLLQLGSSGATLIQQVPASLEFMRQKGVNPTAQQVQSGGGQIWCIGLGEEAPPSTLFYGRTIHEAFLRARRVVNKQRRRTVKSRKVSPSGRVSGPTQSP